MKETELLRKYSDLINESQIIMLPGSNNTKSVDFSRIDPAVAAALQTNPRTPGKFHFADEGDGMFEWGGSGQFIEMAGDAAREFCRRNNTKFARLVLRNADLGNAAPTQRGVDHY